MSTDATATDLVRRWAEAQEILNGVPNEARRTRDPVHLPLARHLARRTARSQALLLLALSGLMTTQLGGAIGSGNPRQFGYLAVFVLLVIVFAVQLRRDARQAQGFLDQHPAAD